MKRGTYQDTLSLIQDIIAEATGARLRGEAEKRLCEVLGNAIDRTSEDEHVEEFSAREVTILLTDLRGFTAVSELYPVEVVLDLLNRYLTRMSEVVFRHQGRIDKFMGDSIMVLFGAPVARADDVMRAVTCAVDMQIAMVELNRAHKNIGMPELFMGIGINTGNVMAGFVGSHLYSEYTVIGDEVNLASRIEAVSLRGQVLISERTYELCGDVLRVGEPMEVYVKGKAQPATLREVQAIPSLGKEVPRQEMRRSPRVEVKIPFVYQPIENDLVISEQRQAMVLDISYFGILADIPHNPPLHSELKLDLDLPLIECIADNLYAKVVKLQPQGDRRLTSLEFTSVSPENNANIRRFVHLLLQEG
jgi:adenylate cyclase